MARPVRGLVKTFTSSHGPVLDTAANAGTCTIRWQRPAAATTDERRSLAVDWRHRSACLEEDPELFFPIGNTGPAILQIEEAKAVCRRCDVREQCLAWALEAGQDHGVWGGMSEDERRALKRRNARARIRA